MRILSFDVEDWFHILGHAPTRGEAQWARFPPRIEADTQRLLEVLARAGQHGTFFCLGWVGRRFPQLVRRIAEAGHEIACHSDLHELVSDLGPAGLRRDLRTARAALEDAGGQKVTAYRAPGFSVTRANAAWFFEVLIDEGIEVDCSIFPAAHDHGGYPGFALAGPGSVQWASRVLREFPMSGALLGGLRLPYTGGGFFRWSPYALTWRLMARERYTMTYFHPRDFDAAQPHVPGLGWLRRLLYYHGVRGTLPKFERLLAEHRFVRVRDAVALIDWELAPRVTVDDLREELRAAQPRSTNTVPAITSAPPANAVAGSVSPRNSAPHRMPKSGMR